ncbi:hypothetical protein AAG570_010179 [Ranatra chinensis]|uniref:PID domain-containing protein n=1 Tax=Ranatra chinensis TaxID=642074 RepID=A0ABD0YXX7_9HEMI
MKVTVTQSGLKAVTKEHGLTEYWSHRITYCSAPSAFPKVFCWVYRHEGRKLKQELRCHAVLCSKEATARRMAQELRSRLAQALTEFKRDKLSKQNARLSLANSVYDNPSLPRRKILLSTGSQNYRPPLERSKSAPKLMSIEESLEEEEEGETRKSFRTKERFRILAKAEEEKEEGKDGVHVRGEFETKDEDKVELDPRPDDTNRPARMSWGAEAVFENRKKLVASLLAESEDGYTKIYRHDHLEYADEESTPSLQSISSGSDGRGGAAQGALADSEEESDESGFAEPLPDDKVRDLPHHQLVKQCLITTKSHCVQV